jgi:hypothetical protein
MIPLVFHPDDLPALMRCPEPPVARLEVPEAVIPPKPELDAAPDGAFKLAWDLRASVAGKHAGTWLTETSDVIAGHRAGGDETTPAAAAATEAAALPACSCCLDAIASARRDAGGDLQDFPAGGRSRIPSSSRDLNAAGESPHSAVPAAPGIPHPARGNTVPLAVPAARGTAPGRAGGATATPAALPPP